MSLYRRDTLVRDESSKGRIFQGMYRPGDAVSKERNVQGMHRSGYETSKNFRLETHRSGPILMSPFIHT